MGRGDIFAFYEYVSDDGNSYAVKLSDAVAVQGGFTAQVSPLSMPGYPFGPKNMRHVWGVNEENYRTRIPVANSSFALFVAGGSFTLGGQLYLVQGAIGEARKLNHLGG